MPQASTITLADGSAVVHDFTPISVSPSLTIWENRDATISAGFMQITASLVRAKSGRKTNKVRISFGMPIEKTVDGVVVVNDVARGLVDVVIPDTLTSAQRLDLATFIEKALANAVLKGYVSNLEPAY